MLEVILLSLGGIFTTLKRWLGKKGPPKAEPPPPPPRVPTDRPRRRNIPLFEILGGAYPTTAEAVEEFFRANYPSVPTMTIAGVEGWPVWKYANKFILILGRPGVNKTGEMRLQMRSRAPLFSVPGIRMRWFVVDPTEAYLPYLFQILPDDVEIIRATPGDLYGMAWELRVDLGDKVAMWRAFAAALFPKALTVGADQFWFSEAETLCLLIIMLFQEKGGEWRLADLIRLFVYPQFLAPFLRQSARTRGYEAFHLVDKMGFGIIATASAQVAQMAEVASVMEHYKKSFSFSSLNGVLEKNCVVHFGFTPAQMRALGLLASAMMKVLTLHAYERNDEHNLTTAWCDEGRFLADFPVEEITARGRGSGLSAVLSSVGFPALLSEWNEKRVKEIIDGQFITVCYGVGHETAKVVVDIVGEIYGNQITTSETTAAGHSWSLTSTPSSSETVTLNYSDAVTRTPTRRTLLTTSDLTMQPQADRVKNEALAIVHCPDIGTLVSRYPFLDAYEGLPPKPFESIPRMPNEAMKLRPFTKEDLIRLKIDETDDVSEALKSVEDKP